LKGLEKKLKQGHEDIRNAQVKEKEGIERLK
jgi:hypothetical protein